MFKSVVTLLCLKLVFHDIDYDGTHNYLVMQSQGVNTREWLVAFNSKKDVHWKDGCFLVEAQCDTETMALDESTDSNSLSWGSSRLAPICSATKIEGRKFLWLESTK